MYEDLSIVIYPDPRLKKVAAPVTTFDADLKALTARMFELMRQNSGVGLAAPQVGLPMRLFVANPTGQPEDDRIYINPQLSEAEDNETGEEGCLSLPGIRCNIDRSKKLHIRAQDVEGNFFEDTQSGFLARVWQHEFDHLNGILIIDRMGPAQKLMFRKKVREMEEKYGK